MIVNASNLLLNNESVYQHPIIKNKELINCYNQAITKTSKAFPILCKYNFYININFPFNFSNAYVLMYNFVLI